MANLLALLHAGTVPLSDLKRPINLNTAPIITAIGGYRPGPSPFRLIYRDDLLPDLPIWPAEVDAWIHAVTGLQPTRTEAT